MITAVCLNPAIDQNAEVDRLRIGGMNRLQNLCSFAAGKGINVAIVLNRLGGEVRCVSFVGEADTPYFLESMEREGVPFCAIAVPGSVRRNIKIVETESGAVSEFNQQGAQADDSAVSQLCDILSKQEKAGPYAALCGSLPPGCGPDTYCEIMRRMPDRRWIVDTSGDALRSALAEKPYLIKPNQTELEELVQARLQTPEAIQNAAVELCRSGVKHVAVSLGAQGALVTDGVHTVFAPAVSVTALFTVGAGDAMLAGMLYGMNRGETVFASLRYGIAAGAACVRDGGIQAFSPESFAELLPRVETWEL